jgi:WD40 repeat protein
MFRLYFLCTERSLTESDDTRCCISCAPDGHLLRVTIPYAVFPLHRTVAYREWRYEMLYFLCTGRSLTESDDIRCCISFAPDGRLLRVTIPDAVFPLHRTVAYWEWQYQMLYFLCTRRSLTESDDTRCCISFAPDGRLLSVTIPDAVFPLHRTVAYWEWRYQMLYFLCTGRSLTESDDTRCCISFAPDGHLPRVTKPDAVFSVHRTVTYWEWRYQMLY